VDLLKIILISTKFRRYGKIEEVLLGMFGEMIEPEFVKF
jgi:hypothetical protein